MWQDVSITGLLNKATFEENCCCSTLRKIINLICRWLGSEAEILNKRYLLIMAPYDHAPEIPSGYFSIEYSDFQKL